MSEGAAEPGHPRQSQARAHIGRAQALLRARDRDGARRAATAALALETADAVERNALGSVLYELGDLERARALFQDVLAELPHYGDALNNLGNVLARDGKPRAAVEFYERALVADPGNPDYLANFGGARQALGDLSGALVSFEQALMLDPTHADARWNRGLARLLTGDLAGGFADYEARWALPEFAERHFRAAKWDGGDVTGLTVLVHSEQGHGDTIQMVRFAPLLKAQGARVILETHAALLRLMQTVDALDEVYVHGDTVPRVDLHVPIMSLPRAFRLASVSDIPAELPYVAARADAPVSIAPGRDGEVRVGLVWAGRATHKQDLARSCPLELFAPLAGLAGVHLFSLQVGDRAADLARPSWRDAVIDLAPQLVDFAVTASAIAELDLVISVDTAVAHLAGALGKPCWVLLPFAPDWRWLLARDDSPWYPSLRLFRQAKAGDWADVVARIAAALAERAGSG